MFCSLQSLISLCFVLLNRKRNVNKQTYANIWWNHVAAKSWSLILRKHYFVGSSSSSSSSRFVSMQSQNNLLLSTESRPPRLHPASCPKCNGISFPGIKRQGRVEDRLCVSGVKIKNWPGYTFPVSLNGIELRSRGTNLPLHTAESVVIHLCQCYLQTSSCKKCFEVKKQV